MMSKRKLRLKCCNSYCVKKDTAKLSLWKSTALSVGSRLASSKENHFQDWQFGVEGRLLLWEQHESENPCSNTVVLLQKLRPCPRKETTRSDILPNANLNYQVRKVTSQFPSTPCWVRENDISEFLLTLF